MLKKGRVFGMLSKSYSVTSYGMELIKVTVEVNVFERGFPGFDIIGLPGKEISESRERIASALKNIGISLSGKKILVNMAPADLPKEGSSYDMVISAGLISCLCGSNLDEDLLLFGEVSLDGTFNYTKRSFLTLLYALENNIGKVLLPRSNADAMNFDGSGIVFGINDINELFRYIKERKLPDKPQLPGSSVKRENTSFMHISEIIGQDFAKRALEISAAGGHNILLEGPPGSGKSMLCKSYLSLLPKLDPVESLEVTKVHSIAGVGEADSSVITEPPFRAPHHTISYAGMMGGSSVPKPGEVSLSHYGTLFLDELPEFSRIVIESLRQPLEEGIAVINRIKGSFIFPSKFTLLSACNPCPCGYYSHPSKECICTPQQIIKYKGKISGPILDRIDMQINVKPVELEKLVRKFDSSPKHQVKTEITMKKRVEEARAQQIQRMRASGPTMQTSQSMLNSRLNGEYVRKFCRTEREGESLLAKASVTLNLSARSYFKVLKIARTIADLDGSEIIKSCHIAESLQYRR